MTDEKERPATRVQPGAGQIQDQKIPPLTSPEPSEIADAGQAQNWQGLGQLLGPLLSRLHPIGDTGRSVLKVLTGQKK